MNKVTQFGMKKVVSVVVIFCFGCFLNAQEQLYKGDFSDWEGNSSITINKNILTSANSGNTPINRIQCNLGKIKTTENTVIQFEWKSTSSDKNHYVAFSVIAEATKNPFFIWFDNKNAKSNPLLDVWQKVKIPISELKTLKRKDWETGSVLERLSFWQRVDGANKLMIKNFKIVNDKSFAMKQKIKMRVWPGRSTVCLPTNLEQFMFIELVGINPTSTLKIKFTLPSGITIKNFPKATTWTSLPPNRIYPTKWQQRGNVAELEFAANIIPENREKPTWIPLTVDVKTNPGDYQLKAEFLDGNSSIFSKTLKVKIYPKLNGKAPKKLKMIAWQYAGLNYEYASTYVGMLKAAGFNIACNLHGDTSTDKTVSDELISEGLGFGVAFFTKKIAEKVKEDFADEKDIQWNETWLLEHPDVYKRVLAKYIHKISGGRKLETILYDAEHGSFRKGKIIGDLTPYSLEVFRKFANISAEEKLTPEIIAQKYLKQWIKFRCHQSNQFATILRDVIDDKWPDALLGVYSGYEFDEGSFKDRTRMNYSIDWKSMADTGLDYGTAGYGGSMSQIQNTANALQGKAVFIPGEMYLVNFITSARKTSSPEAWGMRLINSYLNSGMKGGLSIWYGNDLDGSALISINMAVDFMRKVESFALKGKRDDSAVKVSPSSEEDNVYVLRKGGSTLVIAINTEEIAKSLRIRLVDFSLKGFTSELLIKDLVTGEKIPAKKVLKVKVAPFSYRILSLMNDGN